MNLPMAWLCPQVRWDSPGDKLLEDRFDEFPFEEVA